MYTFGETITTENGLFTFTPVFEGFAEELANWPDEHYLTPEGEMVGNNPFHSTEEKTLMWFSGTVAYIGDSTTDETFSFSYQILYDENYTFDERLATGYTTDLADDWTRDATTMTFEPLSEKKTRIVRFCSLVPRQLESESGKSLAVIFTIGGTEYPFQIR